MKSLAMPPRTTMLCTVCLFSLLFSAIGLAQSYNWQIITQPKIDYLSSIGVGSDVSQILLTGEHDGEWDNGMDPNTLTWAFTIPRGGLFQVHGTRYLAAPAVPQNLYMLDVHGGLYYFVDPLQNGVRHWYSTLIRIVGGEADGWYALAMDPFNANPTGQYVLAGGLGVIKYNNVANLTVDWTYATIVGLPNPPPFITDIQYARDMPGVSSNVWAATSEAAGWDDIPTLNPMGCGGVLRSTDAGQHWNRYRVSTTSTDPSNCVYAVAPISSTQVYAVTKAGLWKGTYTPGTPPTMSWTQIPLGTVGLNRRISSIFYPSFVSPTTLYVGLARTDSAVHGVLKGTYDEQAQTWAWVTTRFRTDVKVNALGGLPSNATTFYAAFANGDVYKTTDGGGSSPASLQGQRAGYPMATLIIPPNQPNDNTVYVGTVCQGGVYKGVYSGSPLSWTWTEQKKPIPGGFHSHFHYVMRLAQDPMDANKTYVTEDNFVFTTTDGGGNWTRNSPTGCNPLDSQSTCVHLHGLAVAPSAPATLYVGSGHGEWPGGSDSNSGRIWRTDDSGNTWPEVTNNFPAPPLGTCDETQRPPLEAGCYSVYTIAVSPNNIDRAFVGTFGHENFAGDPSQGKGIGVVRRKIDGTGNWELLTAGLCPDGTTAPSSGSSCTASLPVDAKSLYVGTVAIDNTTPPNANVYIATLNGLYRMRENGTTWVDISPNFSAPPGTCDPINHFDDCRRFESIAVSPSGNFLLAGTSQPLFDGNRPARIFKSTDMGITWTVWTMASPPNPSRAWAEQFRVRDIQMRTSKAYAVIEGSGIYRLDLLLQTERPR